MPGMAMGSSTSRQICSRLAPRSLAASTCSFGTIEIPSVIGKIMNGR